ncbi:(Fe-S)-binding protein [Dethiothermospora halolimnae]|uniref:(Fe-S)-binding protein n=1 Tax=Dethiothermospora halolimnae TaxID=3114390 RepID=UPI003CCBC8D9
MKLNNNILEKLEYSKENCIGCNKCMEGCSMLNEFTNNPKDLLKNIINNKEINQIIPYSCTLCGYCGEVCPKGISLKDIFLDLRKYIVNEDKKNLKKLNYRPIRFHQKNSFSKVFSTNIRGIKKSTKTVFFPGCSLTAYNPKIIIKAYNFLKEKMDIGIMLNCCGNPTYSMGDVDKFNKYYNIVNNEFVKNGIEEVIVACENCYKTIKENSKGLRVKTLWEVIDEIGLPTIIKGIGKDSSIVFSIHDPCATRNEPKIHEAVRNIVKYLGFKIEEMEYSKEKTLCCGSGGMIRSTNKDISITQMKRRANMAKTEYIISYCQECVESMRKAGKKGIHIIDLIFNDNIYIDFDQVNEGTLAKWINRYRGKKIIEGVNENEERY